MGTIFTLLLSLTSVQDKNVWDIPTRRQELSVGETNRALVTHWRHKSNSAGLNSYIDNIPKETVIYLYLKHNLKLFFSRKNSLLMIQFKTNDLMLKQKTA